MKAVFAALACAALAWPVSAEPVIKVINFTADWCPNCQILNPALEEAINRLPAGEVELVNLDMTEAGRRSSEEDRLNAWADAIRLADTHQAGYLWDWYGGVTGIAAIVSADNGEPIACVNRSLDEDAIFGRLREATIITNRRDPGTRKPNGPECPPPLR